MARARRIRSESHIWPAFVDVLSSLLLVIIFLLVVFMLAQFFLQKVLSGRDAALAELTAQVEQLALALELERTTTDELRLDIIALSDDLQASRAEAATLGTELAVVRGERDALDQELTGLLVEVERLRRDIASLREVRAELEAEVGRLAGALESSEAETGELRDAAAELRDAAAELESRLADESERTRLAQAELEERDIRLAEITRLQDDTLAALESEQALSTEQRSRIALLNEQIAALRAQLARIETALEASEARALEQDVVIADLGRRLNLALVEKVEELAKYRSEFFGQLRKVLGNRPDIRIVGDRFVFQSDVLFDSGSARPGPGAESQLAALARTLLDIAARIPPELPWILQVDGHTDPVPIHTAEFASNWELSSARALSVVPLLIKHDIPPDRVAAAGYGEYHPIDEGTDEVGNRRNRRIELRLTQR